MKKLFLLLLLASSPLLADTAPSADLPQDARVRISIVEPGRDVGYTVGDILTRIVTLEVKQPYELVKTSLPIVGYEKRYKGQVTEQQIVEWCRENMAVYKVPRIVQFADALPKSGSGKVMWRTLQEAEAKG